MKQEELISQLEVKVGVLKILDTRKEYEDIYTIWKEFETNGTSLIELQCLYEDTILAIETLRSQSNY